MLSTLKGEIVRAGKLGVTLGAFNVYTVEQARGVVQAAKKHGAPIFLQSNFANIQAAGGGPFVTYLKELARHADVPVAIHLDHGQSLDEVVQALVMGFTSVMFDGSSLPFEENVAKTKEVERLARSLGRRSKVSWARSGAMKIGPSPDQTGTVWQPTPGTPPCLQIPSKPRCL